MKVQASGRLRQHHPNFRFAAVFGTIDQHALSDTVDVLSNNFAGVVAKHETQIDASIAAFDRFFRAMDYENPLRAQFASAQKRGLPSFPALIKALLYTELTTGVLMGVQDSSKINGDLQVDLAQNGETFQGMRTTITCREAEIVVRDQTDIVASLFQGPDQKTQTEPVTSKPVFYIFSAPGLDEAMFHTAKNIAISLFPDGALVAEC